jgi:hypothetical protein
MMADGMIEMMSGELPNTTSFSTHLTGREAIGYLLIISPSF